MRLTRALIHLNDGYAPVVQRAFPPQLADGLACSFEQIVW
jgi:hypothetical protein